MFKLLKNLLGGRDTPDPVEKAEIASLNAQLSRMLREDITVEAHRIDPDENVQTPKGAEISYLDAEALNFWDGRRTDFEIPNYYSDSAFGRNVGPALKRLIKGGYLRLSDIEKSINLKTVPELKAILAEHELKISGKKSELVYRLTSNLSGQELDALFPVGVYEVTEKGRAALKPYSIIVANDRHSLGFSYYRLLKERGKNPQDSDEDILIRLISQEIQDCYKRNDRAQYQVTITKAARFMNEIGETGRALECYVLGFFIYAMEIKAHPNWNRGGQSYYLASLLEQCGKNEGYSLNQLIEKFKIVLKANHPFGLTTPTNINFSISLFKKSLSV